MFKTHLSCCQIATVLAPLYEILVSEPEGEGSL